MKAFFCERPANPPKIPKSGQRGLNSIKSAKVFSLQRSGKGKFNELHLSAFTFELINQPVAHPKQIGFWPIRCNSGALSARRAAGIAIVCHSKMTGASSRSAALQGQMNHAITQGSTQENPGSNPG